MCVYMCIYLFIFLEVLSNIYLSLKNVLKIEHHDRLYVQAKATKPTKQKEGTRN